MKEFTKAQKDKLKELMAMVKQTETLWNSFVDYLAKEYEITFEKWTLTMEGFKKKENKDAVKK